MSLRARIAWIVGLTVAALIVALGVTVQLQSARTLVGAVDDDLRAIARSIERDPRGFLVLTVPGRDRFGGAAGVVQIVAADGEVLRDRRPRAAADPDRVRLPVDDVVLAVARGTSAGALVTVDVEGVPLRMLVVPIGSGAEEGGAGFALQVARPIDEVETIVGALRRRTTVLTLLGAVLAALVAWAVAGRSIRPVSELTSAVEEVRDGADLGRRVSVPEGDDEVARLARAFDAMLVRLEASRLAQDRFAADAAHELRTPITSLRTNVEVLARDAERLDPDDRRRLTEDVTGQLEELTGMVDGLVMLTRIDTDRATRGEVDVIAIAADVVAAAQRRYPERAADLALITAGREGEHAKVADADARELTLAVSALVDNAVKYAPSGPIEVRVGPARRPTHVRLEVTDRGPGVDPMALPHLFERFFRAPEARAMPGAGLGLALVDRVARAHGGDVAATAAVPNGLSVAVELPVRPDVR